jgi:hypothetical protein
MMIEAPEMLLLEAILQMLNTVLEHDKIIAVRLVKKHAKMSINHQLDWRR